MNIISQKDDLVADVKIYELKKKPVYLRKKPSCANQERSSLTIMKT